MHICYSLSLFFNSVFVKNTEEIKPTHSCEKTHGTKSCTAKTRYIKALHLLSGMNDGCLGAPSDERSRRCLQADLAPQSCASGVTFLPTGWLTTAQPLLSFLLYCEEWWLKLPSIYCRSCCISLQRDGGHRQCRKGYFCTIMTCSLQG